MLVLTERIGIAINNVSNIWQLPASTYDWDSWQVFHRLFSVTPYQLQQSCTVRD